MKKTEKLGLQLKKIAQKRIEQISRDKLEADQRKLNEKNNRGLEALRRIKIEEDIKELLRILPSKLEEAANEGKTHVDFYLGPIIVDKYGFYTDFGYYCFVNNFDMVKELPAMKDLLQYCHDNYLNIKYSIGKSHALAITVNF